MSRYIFVESRGPFESRDMEFIEQTALALRERGHEVTVYLVQNAVLATRKNAHCLGSLTAAGITLLADDLSLRERGISAEEFGPGIQISGIEELVDQIVQTNTKAIWH